MSLDGGALRPRIDELIDFVDVAVVSKKLCEQKSFTEKEMLAWLKTRGCRVGAVTVGTFLVLPALVPGRRADLGRRVLASPLLVGLGVVSYGVYLWNATWFSTFAEHRSAWWSPHPLWALLIAATVVTTLVAYLSFVLVERPVLELAHRAVGTTRTGSGAGNLVTWRVPVGREREGVRTWVDGEAPLPAGTVRSVCIAALTAAAVVAWTLPALRAALG